LGRAAWTVTRVAPEKEAPAPALEPAAVTKG